MIFWLLLIVHRFHNLFIFHMFSVMSNMTENILLEFSPDTTLTAGFYNYYQLISILTYINKFIRHSTPDTLPTKYIFKYSLYPTTVYKITLFLVLRGISLNHT